MHNLGILADEEIERLQREGRLVGPTSNVSIQAMNALLNALSSRATVERVVQPTAPIGEVDQPTTEKIVFGIGYQLTARGIEQVIQSYRLTE